MALRLFEDALQREIDKHLGKLERKSLDGAPPGSLPASPTESSQVLAPGVPCERMDELRLLANQMSANLLHRLASHSLEWGQEEAPGLGDDGRRSAAAAAKAFGRGRRRSDAVLKLEEQVQHMEVQLREKRQDTVARQEELIAKCKSEFATVLNAKEQEILQVQRSVAFDEAMVVPASGRDEHEAVRQDFSEHVRLTQRSLEEARSALAALESKRRGLDKVEAIQRRTPYNAVEELLAKCGPRGLDERSCEQDMQEGSDEECQQLWAAITKGEQVAKKLRRAVSGV